MSLASSPDCLLRPEDKALKYLFPSVEEVNSFDEFFVQELYENSDDDNGNVKQESYDSEDLFAIGQYNLANGQDSGHADTSQSERSPVQPWRKGVWAMKQQPGLDLVVGKTRKAHNIPPSHVSPAHLIANDNFASRSPRFATQPHEIKSLSPDRSQQSHCYSPLSQQRIEREMSLSPSPMYSRSYCHDRNGYVDAWQQDFPEFNIDLNDDFQNSLATGTSQEIFAQPDYTYRRSRRDLIGGQSHMEGIRAATMHNMSRTANQKHSSNRPIQELSSILNANLNATSRNLFSSTPDCNDMSYQFINQDIPAMSDWTASEHSSNSSSNSQSSNTSIENHQHNMYNTVPPHDWWSPPDTYDKGQPGSTYPELVQPKPRRATHHILRSDHLDDGDLAIQYPNQDEIGIAIPYHPPQLQPSSMPPTHLRYHKPGIGHANALSSYPALQPPSHTFPDNSPFLTPRRRAHLASQTPSPPLSPTRTSRSMQQRSPSRRDASQHRRKSLHKSGPRGTETPRHRSTSRPPRTPKTPKTPRGNACSPIGFVNFTPRDASKLLNDVAPSGSSKTRARREQEARERRKKLSEAAIAAVRRAGGDVEALEKAILT